MSHESGPINRSHPVLNIGEQLSASLVFRRNRYYFQCWLRFALDSGQISGIEGIPRDSAERARSRRKLDQVGTGGTQRPGAGVVDARDVSQSGEACSRLSMRRLSVHFRGQLEKRRGRKCVCSSLSFLPAE
ncbi:hypothetical protein WN48_04804 [Eufriesea mexicana]|uniref:Uncharacterized protein n=1 Tax=Eufriesea mexicana TaxID=516756 RepID=A0A310S9X5_9HYME|nr:hypothetical protein WN48_04804 [Eufriesea mexicana]